MHTDYRKLCVELFGTDDVAELRNIAQTLHKKNARNAGRKKKFTAKEISDTIKKDLKIEVDKRKVSVADIKAFGTYEAEIKLHPGISAKVFVVVGEE